jgi:hypothetical protein
MKKYLIITDTGEPDTILTILVDITFKEEFEIKNDIQKYKNFDVITDLAKKYLSPDELIQAQPILDHLQKAILASPKLSVVYLAWEESLEKAIKTGEKQEFNHSPT